MKKKPYICHECEAPVMVFEEEDQIRIRLCEFCIYDTIPDGSHQRNNLGYSKRRKGKPLKWKRGKVLKVRSV